LPIGTARVLFNLKKQDYTFRARIQGSISLPSPRAEQDFLFTAGGKCRVAFVVHRSAVQRHATTRSLRLESHTYYTPYPHTSRLHSPRAFVCSSPSISFKLRNSGSVRFTSNCSWLLTAKVASGVVAESSRSGPRWQFYINKSTAHYTPHEAEPRGSAKHIISSGSAESHSLH
jgi:hypothetical protein